MAGKPTAPCLCAGYWKSYWWGDPTEAGRPRRHSHSFGPGTSVIPQLALRRYQAWVIAWESDARVRNPDDRGEFTLARLIADYLSWSDGYYVKDGRPSGEAANLALAVQVLADLWPDLPADQFTPGHVKQAREALMANPRMTRQGINARVNRIRRMFAWAVAEELIPAHVLTGLQAVAALKAGRTAAPESPPVTPVAESVVAATLPWLCPILRDMVQVLWYTGMRPGEACIMRPCDIDRAGPVWLYRPAHHKTEHHGLSRIVPIGPRAQAILGPYLLRAPAAYLFAPAEEIARLNAAKRQQARHPRPAATLTGPAARLLPHYTPNALYIAIVRACRAANVPGWAPNQLRHAAATRIRREFGLDAAKASLGHTTVTTTEVYAELDLSKAVEVAARVG